MNMVTDMDKFTKFNTANAIGEKGTAIHDATQNALAMGVMMNQMQQNKPEAQDITSKLQKVKTLFDAGLIDEDEFKAKKAELLNLL